LDKIDVLEALVEPFCDDLIDGERYSTKATFLFFNNQQHPMRRNKQERERRKTPLIAVFFHLFSSTMRPVSTKSDVKMTRSGRMMAKTAAIN